MGKLSVSVAPDLRIKLKLQALERGITLQTLFEEIAKIALGDTKLPSPKMPALTRKEIQKSLADARMVLKSNSPSAHGLRALLQGYVLLAQEETQNL